MALSHTAGVGDSNGDIPTGAPLRRIGTWVLPFRDLGNISHMHCVAVSSSHNTMADSGRGGTSDDDDDDDVVVVGMGMAVVVKSTTV